MQTQRGKYASDASVSIESYYGIKENDLARSQIVQ